jgi:hypothetical protein
MIPACPSYGLNGFAAVIAADRAHPGALAVARRVAAGTARPGQVLGAGDDMSWQRNMTGARSLRYEPGPVERRAVANGLMDGNAAVEYLNHIDELERRQRDVELADEYERVTEFRPEFRETS